MMRRESTILSSAADIRGYSLFRVGHRLIPFPIIWDEEQVLGLAVEPTYGRKVFIKTSANICFESY